MRRVVALLGRAANSFTARPFLFASRSHLRSSLTEPLLQARGPHLANAPALRSLRDSQGAHAQKSSISLGEIAQSG
jgi:hypothetical protein